MKPEDPKDVARLFVAIELPEIFKQELVRIQKELIKNGYLTARYVKPEHMHVTLRFVGDVQECEISGIDKKLKQVHGIPITMTQAGFDVFWAGDKIKVVYAYVSSSALKKLAADIDQALLPWCDVRKRDFVGHITLARVKYVSDKKEFLDRLNTINVLDLSFTVYEFVLKKSVLTADGPVYTTLYTYSLQDA